MALRSLLGVIALSVACGGSSPVSPSHQQQPPPPKPVSFSMSDQVNVEFGPFGDFLKGKATSNGGPGCVGKLEANLVFTAPNGVTVAKGWMNTDPAWRTVKQGETVDMSGNTDGNGDPVAGGKFTATFTWQAVPCP